LAHTGDGSFLKHIGATIMKNLCLWASVVALVVGSVAPSAHAACWTNEEVNAAKIKDFETMLMVSALRCKNTPADFITDYNKFVTSGRSTLVEVNQRLRGHFEKGTFPVAGLNNYDRFVTAIANGYGAGGDGASCADMASLTTTAIQANASFNDLVLLAGDAGIAPIIDGEACGIPRMDPRHAAHLNQAINLAQLD
jgi:hypothetical protein